MNLSTQVQQIEMKADLLEHENKQLKGFLCKLITGNSPYEMSLSDNFEIVPSHANGDLVMLSIMDSHNLIATKKL